MQEGHVLSGSERQGRWRTGPSMLARVLAPVLAFALASACNDSSIAPTRGDQDWAAADAPGAHADQSNANAPAQPSAPSPRDAAPTLQALEAALNGELFGVPVGPVEAMSCQQQSASVHACDVDFAANDGPTYPEPFRAHLFLAPAGEGWMISE